MHRPGFATGLSYASTVRAGVERDECKLATKYCTQYKVGKSWGYATHRHSNAMAPFGAALGKN